MASFIRNVSFDCSDPYALAEFWSAVIGHPVDPEGRPGAARGARGRPDPPAPDGDGWVVLADPAGNEFCLVRSESERHP